jgi:FAD/FMN-containing dehydrogenase
VIFERLPAGLWAELAPSPVRDRLSRSVKERFDPAHVLNPGVLGEALAP